MFGFARLERDNRFTQTAGRLAEFNKSPQIVDPLQIDPERRHLGVGQQCLANLGQAGLRLIANSRDIGNRQTTGLHRQVDRHVRGLRNQGHTAVDRNTAVLVGPKGDAIEVVDETIAVGTDHRHFTCGLQERVLQVIAVGDFMRGFTKARCKANGTTCANSRQRLNRLDRCMPVHADKDGIGRRGQVRNRAKGSKPRHLILGGMHHPDIPCKADFLTLPDHLTAPRPATDYGNRAGVKQPRQPVHQAPKGRSNSRLIM